MGFLKNLGQRAAEVRQDVTGMGQAQGISPTASADEAAAGLADGSSLRQRAAINSIHQVGMIGADLLIQFDLMVLPGDMAPYRAYTQQAVPPHAMTTVTAGMTGEVAVLLDEPESVWVDLASFR
ncbi:MAG TPA: hypothetical protein VFI65_10645 [Streptosporangiaceae bacterium]|nr:hypothetical protein [Streptosporangiaceae bacterium]